MGRSPSERDDQHVAGFDVAVNEPGRVRGVQRRGDLRDDVHGPLGGQGAALGEQVRQVGPFHEPHVDVELPVDLPEVVDGDDVWLVQLRGERGLGAEAGLERGVGSQGHRSAV